MSKRPWLPLYVNDFCADVVDKGGLRADEMGVYLAMLMLAWRRDDAALPNDMKWLKSALSSFVTDMHGHQFNRVAPMVLHRFWVLKDDNKWHQKRLEFEAEKAVKRSANGQQSANKRWAEYKFFKEIGGNDPMLFTVTKKERGIRGSPDNEDLRKIYPPKAVKA